MRVLGNWELKIPVVYDVDLDFPGLGKLVQSQQRIGWKLFFGWNSGAGVGKGATNLF